MGSLNCMGYFWALFSFLAMGLSCVGYYMPYWLQGSIRNDTPVFLGTFRRCNYPKLSDDGHIVIVTECGRYTTFSDIPSIWWQVGTITAGVGCGFTIIIAFIAMFACCVKHLLSKNASKVLGALQFLAGLLIGGGCAIYPLGWDSREVRQVCGPDADIFKLGSCSLSWAFYITACGAGACLVCSLFSCHVVKVETPKYVPTRYRQQKPH